MSWTRWALPVAAILAIGVGATLVPWQTPLHGITPVGEVGTVIAFHWDSPIQSPSYRLTVRRGADVVWVANSETTERAVPATLTFERGVSYSWQVEAIDARGEAHRASPLQSFVLGR